MLIFGQGPVIDFKTREKQDPTNTSSQVDGTFWMNTISSVAEVIYHLDKPLPKTYGSRFVNRLVNATNVLLRRNKSIREVIVLGGKTGGDHYPSEAEVAISKMTRGNAHILERLTRGEHSSSNTIENLINYCNEVLDNPDMMKGDKWVIMGTSYHLNRMKLLMHLFDIPFERAISSDDVLRLEARTRRGKVQRNEERWNQ